MTGETLAAIRAHAAREYPRESCGVVIIRKGRERYWACRNVADGPEHFHLHPADYVEAEEQGEVVAIAHSHPKDSPQPSEADRVGCEESELPWLIVNPGTGAVHRVEPSGYVAPLVGRAFSLSVLDCYTLIQDYYARELRIRLADVPRSGEWWHRGEHLYRDHYASVGFVRIAEEDLRRHDLIVMQLGADVANHGAIYLGDGRMLHHPMGRLSGREMYGGYWQKIAVLFLRHREVRS